MTIADIRHKARRVVDNISGVEATRVNTDTLTEILLIIAKEPMLGLKVQTITKLTTQNLQYVQVMRAIRLLEKHDVVKVINKQPRKVFLIEEGFERWAAVTNVQALRAQRSRPLDPVELGIVVDWETTPKEAIAELEEEMMMFTLLTGEVFKNPKHGWSTDDLEEARLLYVEQEPEFQHIKDKATAFLKLYIYYCIKYKKLNYLSTLMKPVPLEEYHKPFCVQQKEWADLKAEEPEAWQS